MASIRSLKKDIDYLMSMVLEDCVFVMEKYPDTDKEKVMDIARHVIVKHREFRKQTNHPDGKKNSVLVKKYFRAVIGNLYSSADASLDQLKDVIRKESVQINQ
jgi:hypothetical protein